jgi:polyketide synthase-associated protein
MALEAGDYDVAWPEPGGGETFGREVAERIVRKGWCVIQTSASQDLCADAYKQATTTLRGFDALKEEFVPDFQGRKPHGKIAFMETDYDGYRDDPLSMFDRDLTSLAAALSPVCADTVGVNIVDRHPALVWVPYGSKKEERMFQAEPLTEDDVEDGTVEKHVLFLMRRGICFFNMIENDGGEFNLKVKDSSSRQSVSLPAKRNRLVVFLASEFSFSYEPVNASEKHVAMATWTLGPDPRSQISLGEQVPMNDSKLASQALGILGDSYPLPVGDRVHIMSMMCRLPGGSYGPESYWSALLGGVDGYTHIPPRRFDVSMWCTESIDDRIPGKSYAKHGGFCRDEEIYEFDREFFGISFDEAKFMAPQQKILLEDGYTALHGAGYKKETLRSKEICVFIGDTGSDWNPTMCEFYEKDETGFASNKDMQFVGVMGMLARGDGSADKFGFSKEQAREYFNKYGGASPMAMTGAANSATCARLSNVLGLNAPVGTADTACSSSLVATGVAMSFLRPRLGSKQDVSVNRYYEAVTAGVATLVGPYSYIGMCALSMISPMGRCFTFDQSGDGYARGEGIGTIFMRGGSDAADTLQQLACLLSNSINQDGRSASMTAPNGPSQTAAIQASMRESGVKASDIDIAECHGTGTALGDPIEVGALRNAMEPRDTVLATASAKCHIGHLEGGAGIGGICKCIAMLRAGMPSPNQHLKELNPNLSVSGFPLLFQTEVYSTCRNSSLTGVSSFGFVGTNGRSDMWGTTQMGASKAGKIDLSKVGQIVVKCPITAGPIDYLTGEPAPEDGKQSGQIQLADVLRDEFADYGVSRHVYEGGFRYRLDEMQEEVEQPLKAGAVPYVSGSWCGYDMEPMELVEGTEATYRAYMKMGETGRERFSFCLNKKKSRNNSSRSGQCT